MATGDITQIVADAIEHKLWVEWPYIDIGKSADYDDQWQELAHDAAVAAVAVLLTPSGELVGQPGPGI